ncbi:MAG: hypothetical protein ABW164_04850 [Sphingobium sp.]
MRSLMMIAALSALTACGGEAPEGQSRKPAAETGAAAQVAALDDMQRNGVFERAIRASGATCVAVTGSERVEVRPGVMGWRARCNDDSAHLIAIRADGTADVTSRTH